MTEGKTSRILQDIAELRPPSGGGILPSASGEGQSASPATLQAPSPSSGLSGPGAGLLGAGQPGVLSAREEVAARLGSQAGPEEKGDGIKRVANFPFPAPADVATQEGSHGLRYDFNLGIRVQFPEDTGLRVRFWDKGTDTCLYDGKPGKEFICSRKKYFMHGVIEVFEDGKLVWSHDYDARGKKVAVVMPAGTLGDPLGWAPYAVRFAKVHDCELTIVASEEIVALMGPVYPEVRFVNEKTFASRCEEFYATYYVGLFFLDEAQEWQPRDFRMVGLHRTAGWILGVDPTEIRPRVVVEEPDTRPIEEPYVVVAVQASCACKMWHNPFGWLDTVAYLKKLGYRVICIDREPIVGDKCSWNALPNGVEDETGDRSLPERARWLKHAEFFVGLSSGLAWLAWAVSTPVVMIGSFTEPNNEFHTPYRVFSGHGCNSCWHDIRTPFRHDDYLFCPRHKGTDRAFECSRNISTSYVISTIRRLCRDLDRLPPSVQHGGPWPEDAGKLEEVRELKEKSGMENRNVLYWEL